jgi:AcrR family transcriptional regulator
MVDTLTRKEREKLSRRQAMLDAALSVFAEKGYASATLDEVAHRAEFGKGTLYLYFPHGKEEILREIIQQMFDREYDATFATFKEGESNNLGFREILQMYISRSLVYFYAQRDVFRVIIKEVNRLMISEEIENCSFVMRHREKIVGLLMPCIQKAIERGEINTRLNPHLLSNMILGNVHGYMMYLTMSQQRSMETVSFCDRPELLEPTEAAEVLTDFLMNGVKI